MAIIRDDAHRDMMNPKPRLSFWQIWNMCFGFLGIQFGFALQNANVSRIFQTLGANDGRDPDAVDRRAADRLLVQRSVISYLSRPHLDRAGGAAASVFLVGAVLASLALLAFPNVAGAVDRAGMLWILDASISVSMEPFRAFVGDQLAPVATPGRLRDAELHRRGFSGRQPVAVDAGKGGRGQHRGARPGPGHGALCVLRRRRGPARRDGVDGAAHAQYSPAELAAFDDAEPERAGAEQYRRQPAAVVGQALAALVAGVAGWFAVAHFGWTNSCTCWPAASPATARCCSPAVTPTRGDGCSPTSCATTACRWRCGGWRWCSSSRGSRCSRCGSTPRRR